MASAGTEGVIVLHTDGKGPAELAETILKQAGWLLDRECHDAHFPMSQTVRLGVDRGPPGQSIRMPASDPKRACMQNHTLAISLSLKTAEYRLANQSDGVVFKPVAKLRCYISPARNS
jgi:hypothetical protein